MADAMTRIQEAFGFVADINKSARWNALIYLATMPVWHYHSRSTNNAFHDLTTSSTNIPPNTRALLGNGLKFIPNPKFNVPWTDYETKTLPRLYRNLRVKIFMTKPANHEDAINTAKYNPRMYTPSNWEPPDWMVPRELPRRLRAFQQGLHSRVFKQRAKSNLHKHQKTCLRWLRQNKNVLVVQCDKNLGPAIIERDRYIKMVLRDHLSDARTHFQISHNDAENFAEDIRVWIHEWIEKYKKTILTKDEYRFITQSVDEVSMETPFSTFYATLKVHKSPLKTRPIVSYSGSLLYSLGVWVDSKLQIAAKSQPAYFKDSLKLKQELTQLELPSNARLFIADAVSMYTNIPTRKGLQVIGNYLREHFEDILPVGPLMEALELVMTNNYFTFGDCIYKQKTGTAMGAPPAPPWANLYMAISESEFRDDYTDEMPFYRRFIDDVFGIWLYEDTDHNHRAWHEFTSDLNNPYFELEWEVSTLKKQVDYMDLTISIQQGRIHTTLYEKPNSLHIYIPPNSCHPPGLLPGMVHGMIHRTYTLCTNNEDRIARARQFFLHLRRRGYQRQALLPLFHSAIERAQNYSGPRVQDNNKLKYAMLFHMQYHPNNIPSPEIQHLWYKHIADPDPGHTRPLKNIQNHKGTKCCIERLIIAYNRPRNLGNLLSYRKLRDTDGPLVSSYL